MKELRAKAGSTLALAAACMLVMALIAVAFIIFALNAGGSRELQQATDGGVLNVAQQVLTITVPASTVPDGSQFSDVADKSGNFSLANINAAYAKAALIAMNAKDIAETTGENGYTEEHVSSICQAAEQLGRQLNSKLTNSKTLQGFFQTISKSGSVRMLGTSSIEVDNSDSNWKQAYLDRRKESNVSIQSNQIPASFNSACLNLVTAADKNTYFPGYQPISIGAREFCFVPYRLYRLPHLVDPSDFQANLTAPFTGIPPNAFSGAAKAASSEGETLHCIAFGQTNPHRTIPLKIQGFIRIVLPPNKAIYMYEGVEFANQSYGYGTTEQVQTLEVPVCCEAEIEATLGNEDDPNDLYSVLFPPEAADSAVETLIPLLLQRINQMNPDYTKAQLIALLGSQPVTPEILETQTFYIWADSSANIHIGSTIIGAASFFNSTTPADGNAKAYTQTFLPDVPNFAVAEMEPEGPDCVPVPPEPVITTELQSQLNWSAGTGYNGFLGELSISRKCLITVDFATCIIVPIPP